MTNYEIRLQKAIAKLSAITGRDYDQLEKAIIRYSKETTLDTIEIANGLCRDALRGYDVTWILSEATP